MKNNLAPVSVTGGKLAGMSAVVLIPAWVPDSQRAVLTELQCKLAKGYANVTLMPLLRCVPSGKTIPSAHRTTCVVKHLKPYIEEHTHVIYATATAARQLQNQRGKAVTPGQMFLGTPVVTLPDPPAAGSYSDMDIGQAVDRATKLCAATATHTIKLHGATEIEQALHWFATAPGPIAFDYETTSLTPWTGDVISVALSNTSGQAAAFMMRADVVPAWTAWLKSPARKLVHSASFESMWSLHKYGCTPTNLVWDTRLAARMLNENESASLKPQALKYTNILPYWQDALPAVSAGKSSDLAPTTLLNYNGGDADATRRLWAYQLGCESAPVAYELMDHNLRLVQMLCAVRLRGVLVDTTKLPITAASILQQTAAVVEKINQLAVVQAFAQISGAPLNLASPVQLSRLLYQYLSLPALMRSRTTGTPSTSTYALHKLRERHPIVPMLLEYRRLTQITKNFLTPLAQLVSPEGVVHPNWNLGGTVTWRLSCSEPNLQNIPRDSAVRELIIPRPGHVFISADYSQVELRILAVLSQEDTLLTAFLNNQDPHIATAAKLYGIDSTEVTDEQRANGKRLNFAAIYGITASGLEQKFAIPVDEGKLLLKRFWCQLPHVATWLQEQRDCMHKYGEVVSVYGRHRRFPDREAFGAERQAGNFPIQSAAADITLSAMLELHNALPSDAYIVGQVHDSILVEAPEADVATVVKLMQNIMEASGQAFTDRVGSVHHSVPFPVEVKTGKDWFHVSHEKGDESDAEEADTDSDE